MTEKNRLIWIDLEMTGLDVSENKIIEIATIVTDSELNIIEEGPSLVIQQPKVELDKMDEWCTKQHTASGLVERVLASECSTQMAEAQTLSFLKKHVPAQTSPMCGNSNCLDRQFLKKEMPALEAYFHYRHIDVSTLKELAARWAPKVFEAHKKQGAHLALDDIRESIEELRYYREHFIQGAS